MHCPVCRQPLSCSKNIFRNFTNTTIPSNNYISSIYPNTPINNIQMPTTTAQPHSTPIQSSSSPTQLSLQLLQNLYEQSTAQWDEDVQPTNTNIYQQHSDDIPPVTSENNQPSQQEQDIVQDEQLNTITTINPTTRNGNTISYMSLDASITLQQNLFTFSSSSIPLWDTIFPSFSIEIIQSFYNDHITINSSSDHTI